MTIQAAYFEWLRAALTSVSGALAGLSEVRLVPGTIDASEARAAQVRLAASVAVLEQLLRNVQTAPEPSPPVEPPAPIEPPAPTPAPVPVDPPAPPPPVEPPAPQPPAPVEPPAPAPEPPAPAPPAEPPAPVPAPPPVEPPAPPPPAPLPAVTPWLRKRKLQLAALISIQGSEIEGGAYMRGQFNVEWAPAPRTVGIRGSNAQTPLTATSYTLTITDQHQAVVYTQTVARTGPTAQFDVPALPVGPYIVDVAASDGIETCYPMGVTVWAEGAPPLALMPLVEHSHRMFRTTVGRAEEAVWKVPDGNGPNGLPDGSLNERHSLDYGMVPARFSPTIEPLLPREATPFTATPDANLFVCREIVPSRAHEVVRPTLMLPQGYPTTSGVECYHHQDFTAQVPPWPLLDGPRGQGTVTGPMFIQVGRNRKLYVLENGRWVVVGTDGTVRTLVGWRHPGIASNFRSAEHNRELVGDWSAVAAIPGQPMGLREPWGHAWDERTLTIAEDEPPIPEEGNESPHVTGPVAFIADTGNNRILRVEFDRARHATPAKVSVFVAGVDHPWMVIYYEGEVFASIRGEHRIAVYDATTGAFKRNFKQGANLGFIDGSAKPRFNISGTRAAAYAEPVSFPEGMVLQDGVLWVGSMMQGGAVRGWNIETGELVREQMVQTDGNTLFMQFALSDGTFYPRGTVFASTWTNNRHGYPWAYLPNGQQVAVQGNLPARGQLFHTGGYGTACAVANGRLYCGQVQEGLLEVTLALPGEQPMDPQVSAGALEYWRKGYRSLCGNNGWGHFGVPLPWGESAAMDKFFEYAGRRRPAVE